MAAGPASYGMTDTMGRMHSDAQFAGSSSVPAHVEMMGLIGMGNNPMVGATVAVAVSVEEAARLASSNSIKCKSVESAVNSRVYGIFVVIGISCKTA